jgi:hypothetical protein
MVVLIDETGVERLKMLTSSSGSYSLQAPAAGRYRLRAERIGHTSISSPVLNIAAGQVLEYRLVATGEAISLDGIMVEAGRRRCAIRPQAGLATATLWEEARKALHSTAYTQRENLFRYEVVQYERDLDAQSERVRREDRQTSRVLSTHPFQSLPAEELSRNGYIQQTKDGTFYYGPDPDVLLSDVFLNDHCFRIAEGPPPSDSLVGLAFEPTAGRKVPEIKGVLWLNRATAELKHLEYRYVRVPVDVDERKLGGRVEFERLPAGPWIVRRWAIRMPELAVEEGRRSVGGIGNDRMYSYRSGTLVGIREAGGEVLRTTTRSGSLLLAAGTGATLEGVVWDSTRAAPLPGAKVSLSGTQYAAHTDGAGRFRLPNLPEGSYSVAFSHPDLDLIPLPAGAHPVTLREGGKHSLKLAVPSWQRISSGLCPDSTRRLHKGVLLGTVRDAATGAAAGGAEVTASWSGRVAGDVQAGAKEQWVKTAADARGFYVVCGVPEGTSVRTAARAGNQIARSQEIQLARGAPMQLSLLLNDEVRVATADTSRAVTLEELLVTVDASRRSRAVQEFYARAKQGGDHFITRADIDRIRPSRTSDLFQAMQGVELVPGPGGAHVLRMRGTSAPAPQGLSSLPRNPDTFLPGTAPPAGLSPEEAQTWRKQAEGTLREADTPADCAPHLYIDGVRWQSGGGPGELNALRPRDIEGIEVYPRTSLAPAQYKRAGAECGIILIWMRTAISTYQAPVSGLAGVGVE